MPQGISVYHGSQDKSRAASLPSARPNLFGSGGRFGLGSSFGLGAFTQTRQGRLPHDTGLPEHAAGKRSGAASTKGQKRAGNLLYAHDLSRCEALERFQFHFTKSKIVLA